MGGQPSKTLSQLQTNPLVEFGRKLFASIVEDGQKKLDEMGHLFLPELLRSRSRNFKAVPPFVRKGESHD
jgi:hypothetical protein